MYKLYYEVKDGVVTFHTREFHSKEPDKLQHLDIIVHNGIPAIRSDLTNPNGVTVRVNSYLEEQK